MNENLSMQNSIYDENLFNRLKKDLECKFPGNLQITGEGTPQSTGWFEVTIDGKLVHSKKNGDGYVDSDAKLSKIVEAIKAALKL
ncbi:selenoprotein W, 1 [Polypterus senegalus]|uniref:selenoprotein W, 1 n=1 Tax=Polypterus senegalus TaxID=55291 RepID=UPI0019653F11|nr:selenoprotein W, 1 [Polypterus senegalus]